jgi:hypothetical protein
VVEVKTIELGETWLTQPVSTVDMSVTATFWTGNLSMDTWPVNETMPGAESVTRADWSGSSSRMLSANIDGPESGQAADAIGKTVSTAITISADAALMDGPPPEGAIVILLSGIKPIETGN